MMTLLCISRAGVGRLVFSLLDCFVPASPYSVESAGKVVQMSSKAVYNRLLANRPMSEAPVSLNDDSEEAEKWLK